MQYLIAHDLGTSGNKATIYSVDGKLINSAVYQYSLYTPKTNYIEQNADDWWKAVCETTKQLICGINPSDVIAVSFSGQMMGCLCVDKEGTPLLNSIIWADLRSTKEEEFIRRNIDEKEFYNLTGIKISSSHSITKLMWVKNNLPEIYKKTYKMLNAKDYIINKLTGNFVTDYSDASSTCMLDIKNLEWSENLIKTCDLSVSKLPELKKSIDIVGYINKEASLLVGLLEGTPIVCGGGDGACAAVGSGCIRERIANCCLGTSSWISTASRVPIYDANMTTFNFVHIIPEQYLSLGTMQSGGASLNWAIETLYSDDINDNKKQKLYHALRDAEKSPVGANSLIFLPYLIGERSPWWDSKAKGAFIGLNLNHTRKDMIRSVLEGVALNLNIILKSLAEQLQINDLVILGGGAKNNAWIQIISDVLNIKINKPNYLEEATSMGAAITAGIGIGVFNSFDIINKFMSIEECFSPSVINNMKYEQLYPIYKDCYFKLKNIFHKLHNIKMEG